MVKTLKGNFDIEKPGDSSINEPHEKEILWSNEKALDPSLVKSLENGINTLNSLKGNLIQKLTNDESQQLFSKIYTTSNQVSKTALKGIKESPNNEICLKHIESDVTITYDEERNIITFRFPGTLPHQVRYDSSAGKVTYQYDKQQCFSRFFSASSDFIKEHTFRKFEGKCHAMIYTIYSKDSNVMDHDNLDAKYFIDGALKPFLMDDDPFHLSLSFDAEYGETEETVVIFGPVGTFGIQKIIR